MSCFAAMAAPGIMDEPMPNSPVSITAIARLIDHSVLQPTATDEEILRGCVLSREAKVAAFCTKPYAVPLALAALGGSGVAVFSVIAFPHGNSTTAMKVHETKEAVDSGAREIDVVIN